MRHDRTVLVKPQHALDFVEIDNDGAPFALRIAGALLLVGQLEDTIPFRRNVGNPCTSDELQQRNGLRPIHEGDVRILLDGVKSSPAAFRAQKLNWVSLKTAVLPRNDSTGLRSRSTAANNNTLPVSNAPVTSAEISGVIANMDVFPIELRTP